MKITSTIKLNNTEYTFEIEERNEKDTLLKAIVLTNPRLKCDVCSNFDREKFKLDGNKDKEGNVYINNVCRACGAKSKLGEYKSGGGYFWKTFEKFEGTKPATTNNTTPDKFGNTGGDWSSKF